MSRNASAPNNMANQPMRSPNNGTPAMPKISEANALPLVSGPADGEISKWFGVRRAYSGTTIASSAVITRRAADCGGTTGGGTIGGMAWDGAVGGSAGDGGGGGGVR